jgi:hypothetical protein
VAHKLNKVMLQVVIKGETLLDFVVRVHSKEHGQKYKRTTKLPIVRRYIAVRARAKKVIESSHADSMSSRAHFYLFPELTSVPKRYSVTDYSTHSIL